MLTWLTLLTFSLLVHAQDYLPLDPNLQKAAEAEWNSTSHFTDTHILAVKPSTQFAKRVPLNLVMLSDSKWTPELVLEELRGIERVFAQCEVSFRPITFIQTSTKLARKWWSDFDETADAKVFDGHLMTSRPTIIYRKSGGAYSWPSYYLNEKTEGHPELYPQLLNTAVVSYASYLTDKNTDYVPKDYVVSAHEIAHILFNSPHRGDCGNLLHGGPTCKGSQLTPADCEALRLAPAVRSP